MGDSTILEGRWVISTLEEAEDLATGEGTRYFDYLPAVCSVTSEAKADAQVILKNSADTWGDGLGLVNRHRPIVTYSAPALPLPQIRRSSRKRSAASRL